MVLKKLLPAFQSRLCNAQHLLVAVSNVACYQRTVFGAAVANENIGVNAMRPGYVDHCVVVITDTVCVVFRSR